MTSSSTCTAASAAASAPTDNADLLAFQGCEVVVDLHERRPEHLDLARGQHRPQLAIDPLRLAVQRGETLAARRGDDDPHDAPVVGVGPPFDVAVVSELVEVAYKRRRLDA